MIDPQRYHQRAEALNEMLQARLGVRGKGLDSRLARAGRRLPRPQRRAAREIARAGRHIGHPKLARLIDPVRTEQAFDSLTAHLKGIDRAEVRRHALLSWLAVVVFNLLVLGLAVLALVKWQALP